MQKRSTHAHVHRPQSGVQSLQRWLFMCDAPLACPAHLACPDSARCSLTTLTTAPAPPPASSTSQAFFFSSLDVWAHRSRSSVSRWCFVEQLLGSCARINGTWTSPRMRSRQRRSINHSSIRSWPCLDNVWSRFGGQCGWDVRWWAAVGDTFDVRTTRHANR